MKSRPLCFDPPLLKLNVTIVSRPVGFPRAAKIAMSSWHECVGLIGTAMIIGTYLALQMRRISSTGLSYSLLNAMGAALLAVSLLFAFNLSALIVEGFWVLISVVGIVRHFRDRPRVGEK
jgi:hypothetical protein